MRASIHETDFTWEPEQQTRQEIWAHIKEYIQSEIALVDAVSKQQARRRRLLESSYYYRDRSILPEHEFHGVDVATLARLHAVSLVRIREIIRMARRRERLIHLTPRLLQTSVAELP